MKRSALFLPGNNPNMLVNGDVLGADAIILDLEDAVSPDDKDSARILVRNALKYLNYKGTQIIVRINSIDENGFWMQDLDEIIPMKPNLIMPTKVDGAEYVKKIADYIDKVEKRSGIPQGTIKLMPLIETAIGVENAFAIAGASKRVTDIFLGAEDLTADLRCPRTKEGNEIYYARTRVVCAARALGIQAYDTPFTDVNDDEGLLIDTQLAKSLGFSGKAAISPRHVETINKVFTPTDAEIAYAHEVLAAIEEAKKQGKGAISLYGKMIDAPIVARAKQVLASAPSGKGGKA